MTDARIEEIDKTWREYSHIPDEMAPEIVNECRRARASEKRWQNNEVKRACECLEHCQSELEAFVEYITNETMIREILNNECFGVDNLIEFIKKAAKNTPWRAIKFKKGKIVSEMTIKK